MGSVSGRVRFEGVFAMTVAVAAFDVGGLLAFGFAFVLVCLTRLAEPRDVLARVAKVCLLFALGVYVFAMLSNVLEHLAITDALDPFEDYLEILFAPFLLYSIFTMSMKQRQDAMAASQRAALASQQMMLAVLDSAPAGIIVLDSGGRITFSNAAAKEILDLDEDEGGTFTTPGWSVRVADSEPANDFRELLPSGPGAGGVPVTVEWPNGWRIALAVHAEELGDSTGGIGGIVATFLPPSARPEDGGA